MGARRNIKLEYRKVDENGVKDFPIYFYTHWGAEELPETLKNALKRGFERWDDESYLARIIFSEMIKDDVLELTGYGIAPYPIDDKQYPTITVNLEHQTVDDVPFHKYVEQS